MHGELLILLCSFSAECVQNLTGGTMVPVEGPDLPLYAMEVSNSGIYTKEQLVAEEVCVAHRQVPLRFSAPSQRLHLISNMSDQPGASPRRISLFNLEKWR